MILSAIFCQIIVEKKNLGFSRVRQSFPTCLQLVGGAIKVTIKKERFKKKKAAKSDEMKETRRQTVTVGAGGASSRQICEPHIHAI